jgi:hypothetical protein
MESFAAFKRAEASRGNEMMVFDWAKAARLVKERKPTIASAGLRGDWEYTGGEIWKDGKPVPEEETYVYLASTWAVPELELDGEVVECYVMQNNGPRGKQKRIGRMKQRRFSNNKRLSQVRSYLYSIGKKTNWT